MSPQLEITNMNLNADELAAAYKAGATFAELENLDTAKILALTSNGAMAAYKAGIKLADLKDLKVEEIKALNSSDAIETYKAKTANHVETENLDDKLDDKNVVHGF